MAFIIIYDSFNVRRSVGLQGKTINLMIDYYKNIDDEKEEIKKLKAVMDTPSSSNIRRNIGHMRCTREQLSCLPSFKLVYNIY